MASSIELSFPAEAHVLVAAANYRGNKIVGVRDQFDSLEAGGGIRADTGINPGPLTTQADEVWVAGFSARGVLGHAPFSGFTERAAVDDGNGRTLTLADKVVAAAGNAWSRTVLDNTENANGLITFKALTPGVPMQRVQYAEADSGGVPVTSLSVPWAADPQLNDLLVVWIMTDYVLASDSDAGTPVFDTPDAAWVKQIYGLALDDHYFAYMFYGIAPEPPPPVRASAIFLGVPKGTPAHFISSPKGDARSLDLANWLAVQRANGGWIGMTAQIDRDTVRANPALFSPGSHLVTVRRETGEPMFTVELKEPGDSGAVVDLSGDGPHSIAAHSARRIFLQNTRPGDWVEQGSEPHERGKPPKRGPTLDVDGAGNVKPGKHKYRLTFVSADGETRGGPVEVIYAFDAGTTFQGDYDDAEPYIADDVVHYGSDYWKALNGNTGVSPVEGADWTKETARKIQLTDIPIGPKYVSARKIYRTEADELTYKLLSTLGNNSDTTYTDNTADVDLGAPIAPGWAATEIDARVRDDGLKLSVDRGADIEDGQLVRLLFSADEEPTSRVAIDTELSRHTASYTLLLETAEDEESDFETEASWTLDELPGEIDVNVAKGRSVCAFGLRREGAVVNAKALDLTLRKPRVNGVADDDFYSTSELARLCFTRMGIDQIIIQESGVNALPGDFRGMTYEDVLDIAQILTGRDWRWLVYRIRRRTVGEFRPFGAGGRILTIVDPEATRDLLPQTPANRAVVKRTNRDGRTVKLAEAIADPNPLDRIVTGPPLVLDHPVTHEKAKALAQHAADYYAFPHPTGPVVFTRFQMNGVWHDAHDAMAGDLLYIPGVKRLLPIDELQMEQSYCRAITEPGMPQIERFNARLAKQLELKGKL